MAKSAKRLYVVSDGSTDLLVEARSEASAVAHAAKMTFQARLAAQGEITHLRDVCGVAIMDAEESK